MNKETPPHENIQIDHIRLDGQTQVRCRINSYAIKDYFEAICRAESLPPIVVFQNGNDLWLADGFHRYHAAVRAKYTHIRAAVYQGNQRDALLYALSANNAHGLKETREDKQNKISLMLQDPEWRHWSDREIGNRCGVTGKTVASARKKLGGEAAALEHRNYQTRHGTVATRKFPSKNLTTALSSDTSKPSTAHTVEQASQKAPETDATATQKSTSTSQFHAPEINNTTTVDEASMPPPSGGVLAEICTKDMCHSEKINPDITAYPNQKISDIMAMPDSERRKYLATQDLSPSEIFTINEAILSEIKFHYARIEELTIQKEIFFENICSKK